MYKALCINKHTMKRCIYLILLFVIFERAIESLGAPHSIIFIIDVLNMYLLVGLICGNKIKYVLRTSLLKVHGVVFLISLCVALINGVSIFLILWAIRNVARFYVFFGACVSFLDGDDIDKLFILFKYIFFINTFVIVLQYVMGIRGDYLGGVFGTASGANSYNNIFLIIECTYYMSRWLERREKSGIVLLILGLSLFISVITETKVFFFQILIIIGLCIWIVGILEGKSKSLLKGFIIILLTPIAILIGAKAVAILYPNISNSDFLSINGLKYILTRKSGYSGAGDLNRLTAISTINELGCFSDNFWHRLFGLGLGGAEYSSSIGFLQSGFYKNYEYLHYFWFSHAWMYIETGYIGLLGYILGFFSCASIGIKIVKQNKKSAVKSYQVVTGIVISIMTLLLCIYNQTLRIESAYLLYLVFASIYIEEKRLKDYDRAQC